MNKSTSYTILIVLTLLVVSAVAFAGFHVGAMSAARLNFARHAQQFQPPTQAQAGQPGQQGSGNGQPGQPGPRGFGYDQPRQPGPEQFGRHDGRFGPRGFGGFGFGLFGGLLHLALLAVVVIVAVLLIQRSGWKLVRETNESGKAEDKKQAK